ncbi:hypothetical protein COU59_01325 [Candidatus Pacearchaeota archaeon CG10_big_fil_rev_8_21_14_0_10_34_12]|nr:MAG: hypothetical protein COU59_01325 [Candidatus Pacearchaeota archaeon CG10_big_fil_rev_8_21_14_0_10_34_12]
MKSKDKKLKILAIGDTHNDERMIKKLAEKAEKENVDLIILTGDLTFLEHSTKNIIGPFAKAKKQVLILHGNHDSISTINFLAEAYSNAKSLHGYYFIKNNVGIFGAGGADIGTDILDEKETFYLLQRSHEKIKNLEKRIMVTHMHPSKTKSEFSGFKGSKAIRKAIEKFQPDLAIFSHIHEAAGTEDKIGKTKAINVSRKEKIFEI